MKQIENSTNERIVKRFYDGYHDRILDKRYNSPFWIRRYTHRQIYRQILRYIQADQKALDTGCGEGLLSILAAQKGAVVTGSDISYPNIESARRIAAEWGVPVRFLQADAEALPFPDHSFDIVIGSHVLEHLVNPSKGLQELYRVTRSIALIAMPTCLSPACWVLLGGDDYWKPSTRSLIALPLGFIKTMMALMRNDEGPNETYAGNRELPHVWRFPWVMRGEIEQAGFRIVDFEAGPMTIPYLPEVFPFMRKIQMAIDNGSVRANLRYFGYGSFAVCKKE